MVCREVMKGAITDTCRHEDWNKHVEVVTEIMAVISYKHKENMVIYL